VSTFPDNTVLCNFAAVDRLDLLQAVLNGRGRWTATVAYEAGRSARFLPALASIATEGWLEEPIEIAAEPDVQRVNRVRRAVFGGTDDEPLKHLGEAETCFVKEWTAFAGSWWIGPVSSTTDHAVSSATEPQQKSSPTSWPARLLPPVETATTLVRQ